MRNAIAGGFLFGLAGLGLLRGVAHAAPPEYAEVWGVLGGMLGAIFGAIVGGTGAIVDAIKQGSHEIKLTPSWSASRMQWIVAGVILLVCLGAIATAMIYESGDALVAPMTVLLAIMLYLVLRPKLGS